MNRGDKYYGDEARKYDARRKNKNLWHLENAAVDELVNVGPVLDVPVGTARYGDMYKRKGLDVVGVDISSDMLAQAKRKHPWMSLQAGSITDLQFSDDAFETAVCTRLLNWLDASRAEAALNELCRVARNVVFSARVGLPGRHGRKTENRLPDFLSGHNITHKLLLSRSEDAEYCMWRIAREPETQAELQARVANEFLDFGRTTAEQAAYQLGQWVKRGALDDGWQATDEVRREWWTAAELRAHLERLHPYSPGAITEEKPRREPPDSSAVLIDCGGRLYHMDGRRRMNLWSRVPSLYSVFIIKAVRA